MEEYEIMIAELAKQLPQLQADIDYHQEKLTALQTKLNAFNTVIKKLQDESGN